ncbi:MAG TPA: hypothetical protein VMG59_11530 [Phycisphaerae bacterium]|nr:hypothetical protein [Phycisphaerae bacterium]
MMPAGGWVYVNGNASSVVFRFLKIYLFLFLIPQQNSRWENHDVYQHERSFINAGKQVHADKEGEDENPADDARFNYEGAFTRAFGIFNAKIRPDNPAQNANSAAQNRSDNSGVHVMPFFSSLPISMCILILPFRMTNEQSGSLSGYFDRIPASAIIS